MLRKNLLNTDHESHMQVSTTNNLQIYSRTIKIKNYNDTENLHLFSKRIIMHLEVKRLNVPCLTFQEQK